MIGGCPVAVQQAARVLLALVICLTYGYVAVDDTLRAQPTQKVDPGVLAEQLQGVRDRISRNEQILFPAAAAVQAIQVDIAAMKETITAVKWIGGAIASTLLGQLLLAFHRDRPHVRRRRRREDVEEDTDEIDTGHHVRRDRE